MVRRAASSQPSPATYAAALGTPGRARSRNARTVLCGGSKRRSPRLGGVPRFRTCHGSTMDWQVPLHSASRRVARWKTRRRHHARLTVEDGWQSSSPVRSIWCTAARGRAVTTPPPSAGNHIELCLACRRMFDTSILDQTFRQSDHQITSDTPNPAVDESSSLARWRRWWQVSR